MTTDFTVEVNKLTEVCREIFGDQTMWIAAGGYPDSLALCIIDSIFSTGSHYQSVINVVAEYCKYRKDQGADPYTDGTKELLATFEEVGGSAGWAKLVDNHKPAHTKPGALPKTEVIYRATKVLDDLGITTVAALHELHAVDDHLTPVKKAWLKLPSQSSGVTFNYFLILAGFQSVKPDRMVIRFVEEHAGLTTAVTPTQTAELIKKVAELYPTEARRLDHVIWRYASGREFFRAELS
ncbi:hypothetical protein [Arthrobacter sp. MMS18-M83]|uniref:hypothetical protein n=1 Tax=Arthrobacter sp. MMS18-M83 TaxID=2996261 RepID=UPI00227C04EA|nr:hypothetical protein [Arthrobacter sp. MMS18-M83]WAH97795.1 hypothetical protein OW521_02530 [Arthrobacter sp. MMS18-M83]